MKDKSYSEYKKDKWKIGTISNDLETIWICQQCQMTRALLSVVADHKQTSGHTWVVEYEYEVYQTKTDLDARSDDWQEKNR